MSRLDHVDLTDADAIMAAAMADAQETVGRADPFTCDECHVDDGGHTRACSMAVPLELCNGSTPQCPHYECPDGWHDGEAPNCSCTPDCAMDELTEELIVKGELVPPEGRPATALPDPRDFWPVDHEAGE